MNKILAINGKFYIGTDTDENKLLFCANKKDAEHIKCEREKIRILGDVFRQVLRGKIELKRLELFDVREGK